MDSRNQAYRLKETGGASASRPSAVLCLLFLSILSGCLTPSPLPPPAPIKDKEAFVSLPSLSYSPETQYVLTRWFCERYGEDGSAEEAVAAARRRCYKAERDLVATWASGLLAEFSPHLRPRGSHEFYLEPLAFSGTEPPTAVVDLMQKLKQVLAAGIPVQANPAECLEDEIWHDASPAAKADFSAWLGAFPGYISVPSDINIAEVLQEADAAIDAAQTKARILAAIGKSMEAEKLRRSAAAVRELVTLRDELGLCDRLLQPINDTSTAALVNRRIFFLTQLSINEELSMIEIAAVNPAAMEVEGGEQTPKALAAQDERVSDAEDRLSRALRNWQENELFTGSLPKYQGTISGLAERLCRLRIEVWQRQLTHLAMNQSPWHASVFLRKHLAEIRDNTTVQFACYRYLERDIPLIKEIERELCLAYSRKLPDLFDSLLKTAEQQAELELHHGVSIAMCATIIDMAGVIPDEYLPEPLRSKIEEAQRRLDTSVGFFGRQVARRGITITEFDSVIAGQGMIFRRDLLQQLRTALADDVAAGRIELRSDTEGRPGDYLITNGFIADFNAGETTDASQFRIFRRWGEISRRPNPEFAQYLVQGNKHPPVPAEVFEQSLLEYAIRVHALERLGHVRLSLDLVREDRTDPFVLNHFFRRRFIHEEIHPFADVRPIELRRAYSPDQLNPVGAEPVLISDRVWTENEMLDWLRRVTQELVVLRIVRQVRAFELELASRATAFEISGDLLNAINLWGYCYQYEQQTLEGQATREWLAGLELRKLTDDPEIQDELKRIADQEAQRQELASRVQQQMVSDVMQFLTREGAQVPKNDTQE